MSVQVFSQMVHVGVELEFGVVLDVLEATVLELQRNHAKIANPGPKDDVDVVKVRTVIPSSSSVRLILLLYILLHRMMWYTE